MNPLSIQFENVIPAPLADYPTEGQVWRCGLKLEFPARILLNASSGKGKTTFSSIVYGLRNDYSGKVLIDGKDVSTFSLNDWILLRRMKLSAIFQDMQLFPKLTAWENLILKNNLTSHRDESRIEQMLARLGMAERKHQLCGTLSLGQQQRIAIVRGMLQPFHLLVMDEPFSHIDEENAAKALELIEEETALNGAGYILTTLGSRHGKQFDREVNL